MKKIRSLFLALSLLSGCSSQEAYPRWVGDIAHNHTLDDEDFRPCHGDQAILQYFHMNQGGLKYEGDKMAITKYFQSNYQPVAVNERGMIRIRFIVNCEGQTGRFRLMQADEKYQDFIFDKRITDQLLLLTKKMEGWPILPNKDNPRDYYQYLIFKIDQGQLKEILP